MGRKGADFVTFTNETGTFPEISQCAPSGKEIPMSNISCFWAFIPMILTGIAEILVNPVTYQFAFAEAPHQLLSVSQSFNLVVAGAISNCVTGPISNLLVKDNLNNADYAPGGFYGGGGDHCNINWYFLFNIAIAV